MNENFDTETLDVLKNFIGQTYGEICRYDQSLLETNRCLTPRRNEFKAIAENVLKDVNQTSNVNNGYINHQHAINNSHNTPYIDTGRSPQAPPNNDPNQMEFKFDESIIQIFDKKLDSVINKMNSIDKSIKSLLSFIQYESKNSE